MNICGIIILSGIFILVGGCCLPEIAAYLTSRRQSQNIENKTSNSID